MTEQNIENTQHITKKTFDVLGLLFFTGLSAICFLFEFHKEAEAYLKNSDLLQVHVMKSWVLNLLPAAFAWPFLLRILRKQRLTKLQGFLSPKLTPMLTPSRSFERLNAKLWIFAVGLSFTVIASADPRWGTKIRILKKKGIDVIIAVDLSESMQAKDISTGSALKKIRRLQLARRKVNFLMDNLKGERIGIIAFAGQAEPLCPLTVAYNTCALWLKSLDPSIIPKGGTAIAETINKVIPMFSTSGQNSKALFLITDGDDHSKNTIASAKKAKKKGIRIYTLGIGSPNEVVIQPSELPANNKADQRPIRTKMNETLLKKIAVMTGGQYRHASFSHKDIQSLFSHATQTLEKRTHKSSKVVIREARFPIFLGLALLFFLLEVSIRERKVLK